MSINNQPSFNFEQSLEQYSKCMAKKDYTTAKSHLLLALEQNKISVLDEYFEYKLEQVNALLRKEEVLKLPKGFWAKLKLGYNLDMEQFRLLKQ